MRRLWVTSPSYEAAIATLVAVRTRLGVSQRELAERLDKPRSFVSKIESRERRIDIVELIAVANALGIQPGDLLNEIATGIAEPLNF